MINYFAFLRHRYCCKTMISCCHYRFDLCCFKIFYSLVSFLLHLIDEDKKSQEYQVTFNIFSLELQTLIFSQNRWHELIGQCNYSESLRSVLLKFSIKVFWNACWNAQLFNLFGGSFNKSCNVIILKIHCDYTHPHYLRVEVKSSHDCNRMLFEILREDSCLFSSRRITLS